MAMSTAKFLENVFKIRRMKDWVVDHPGQWQQFSDWAGTGVGDNAKLNADQRKWLEYLQRNADGTFVRSHGLKNGFLEVKDFPPTTDLSEADWKQLFLTCQATFVRMKHNKSSYDGVVQDFITDNSSLFDDVTDDTLEASPTTDNAILELIKKMDSLGHAELYNLFGIEKREIEELVERDPGTRVITSVKKTYNKKKEVREKIQRWADIVLNPDDTKKTDLKDAGFDQTFIRDNLIGYIKDEYHGWRVPDVSSPKLADFKANYADYFTEIYKENKILEAYKSCESDNKVVSESIEKAKKDIDYDDTSSKNYVPRKLDAELTPIERIQEWVGNTYSDYFKKYEELRGARVYHHASEVKDILKQIDKAKIKTTDPLSKLAENADNITKALRLTHPEAANAFEWLGTALKEFNADPKMSKVMEKALKNGRKMNDLISELIMRAAEDGKPETIKKAEIAMEVLSTIKYGYTTSKIMNSLKEDKELFNFLSNKDLSWNKNEGVKFVTAAIDKSFRIACLGIGYGGTFAVNRFRRFGTKFNGRLKNEKMRQSHEEWLAQTGAERLAARGAHGADTAAAPVGGALDLRSEYKKSLDENQIKRANALGGLRGGVAAADADAFIEQYQQHLNTDGRNKEGEILAKLQPYEYIEEQLNEALRIKHKLNEYRARMGGVTSDKQIELEEKLNTIGEIDLTLVHGGAHFDPVTASEAVIELAIQSVRTDRRYNSLQRFYSGVVSRNYEKQQHIDDYRKATKEIKEAEERIEARRKKMEKLTKNDVNGRPLDIYRHLMAYWDTLQDPTLTRYGPRRASKIQENNSTLVADLFKDNLSRYNLR